MTLNLFELAAEVASLNGNFQQMEEWINVVLSQAKTAVDKMKVYDKCCQNCLTQGCKIKFTQGYQLKLF